MKVLKMLLNSSSHSHNKINNFFSSANEHLFSLETILFLFYSYEILVAFFPLSEILRLNVLVTKTRCCQRKKEKNHNYAGAACQNGPITVNAANTNCFTGNQRNSELLVYHKLDITRS